MALTVGSRLGHYDVTALIGEGGMGQVYQATDTKLNRQVALKILPEAFAADPDRLARFQREAQVLASLNHPGIAAIYGLEESEGTKALVLELVEGPTLADRIALGAIPIDEALPIAKQIAEALEAAHEQGIIHRDLKPANVKVKADGTVKVLDFGLAKALDTTPEGDPSQSPTLTAAATQMGVILGTAGYMSPEQARGDPTDSRADIWAFGAVLFEMLAGRRAFRGDTASETLAEVFKSDPPWEVLPAGMPSAVLNVMVRCLDKVPRERIRHIGDARLAMAGAFETISSRRESSPGRPWLPWIAAFLLAMVAAIGVWLWPSASVGMFPTSRTVVSVPPSRPVVPGLIFSDVTISPDGRRIIYRTEAGLDVRALDQLDSTPLSGAENGVHPFVSPDGVWVGFQVGGLPARQRVSMLGGPRITICDLPAFLRGATWGPDDVIIYGVERPGGLWQVPATGGQPMQLTSPENGEASHRYPDLLPNGAGVLFTVSTDVNSMADDQIAVLDLATNDHRVILESGTFPQYANSGHVVFAVGNALRAVPFDPEALEVLGDPVTVVEGVVTKFWGTASFAISEGGALVYVQGVSPGGGAPQQFVWVDADGTEEVLRLPARSYADPSVAPDGRRIAMTVIDRGRDLWVYDAVSADGVRLSQGLNARGPVWTPDGARILFASQRLEGLANIYSVAADGSGQPEVFLASEHSDYPTSVSADGQRVVFTRSFGGLGSNHREIWEVATDGDSPPVPLLQGQFVRDSAEYSPDGNWLVYTSNQSGRTEVYVQPHPGPGSAVPASVGGGTDPDWAPDGSHLFYRLGEQVMAVTVAAGDSIEVGRPTEVFRAPHLAHTQDRQQSHVAHDGRFLVGRNADLDGGVEEAPPQVVLVQNWFEELAERVPVP